MQPQIARAHLAPAPTSRRDSTGSLTRVSLAICLFLLASLAAPGNVLFKEAFNYPDGGLVSVAGGKWTTISPPTGEITVAFGGATISAIGTESVAASLGGSFSNLTLYASFVLNVPQLPPGPANFFLAFNQGGSGNYRCRVFETTTGAGPGFYRLGIANTTNGEPTTILPMDLTPGSNYVVVLRYNTSSPAPTNSTLWINPVSEADTNTTITALDAGNVVPISTIAIHQGPGLSDLTVDNIKVATTFNEVAWQSYVLSLHTGYNLIANQLDHGDNTLNEVFADLPFGSFGSVIFKFDNNLGDYVSAHLDSGGLGWVPANLRLNPGEGAFFFSPQTIDLTISGTRHVPVLPLASCSGYRLLSRQTNDIGTSDNILGFPPVDGEKVIVWHGDVYEQFDYFGAWSPQDPLIDIGQSAWVILPPGSGPDCGGTANRLYAPPVITAQPQSQSVPVGDDLGLFVQAFGFAPTLTYQWRLNGVNIAGATNSLLTLSPVKTTDGGIYTVAVATPGGAAESDPAVVTVNLPQFLFADNFAARQVLAGTGGTVQGDNFGASKEPGEPNHANNVGGASVWFAWQPIASGIATISTLGSSFDTLLAVYRGTNLATLKRVASDDDSAGFFASKVAFNALAGATYNIAIDGAYGANGSIVLSYNLEQTPDLIPEVDVAPRSRVVVTGDSATLSVAASAGNNLLNYQWFFDGLPIAGAIGPTYTIAHVGDTDMGLYRVLISTGPPPGRQVFSTPAFIQLSDVFLGDFVNVIAQDKFLDATGLGKDLVVNQLGPVVHAAPVSGFTGTQTFSTYGSSKEPGEPNHCGEPGGASYWLAYLAPANGTLSVNTSNSLFDTVLAVYSGPAVLTSFAPLVSVGCANLAGLGNEVVNFSVTNSSTYYIVVDGVGGATGTAKLSYNMISARPVVANQPKSVAVPANGNGTVSVAMANTSVTPLYYQWRFNSSDLSGATQSSYTRNNFQPSHQGNYRVVVTNAVGAVTSSIAMMYLDAPPIGATNSQINGNAFQCQWLGPTGSLLIVQVSTNFTNWSSVNTGSATSGYYNYTDSTPAGLSNRFYRVQLAFP